MEASARSALCEITGRFFVSAYRDLLLGAPSGIKNVIRFA
jgi:hypothetical protein